MIEVDRSNKKKKKTGRKSGSCHDGALTRVNSRGCPPPTRRGSSRIVEEEEPLAWSWDVVLRALEGPPTD